jgi:hypothetical protein
LENMIDSIVKDPELAKALRGDARVESATGKTDAEIATAQ